jgi:hypothetical protein
LKQLTYIEKCKLERELGMSSGYVLKFTNRSFEAFFREVVGVAIYSQPYDEASGSKANRLRAFWNVATQDQLVRFVEGLRDCWTEHAEVPIPDSARSLLNEILRRLRGSSEEIKVTHNQEKELLGSDVAARLGRQLVSISSIAAQKRGYDFEKFLRALFDAYQLSANSSFRIQGEQIDGSFKLHNEIYLLEAKWQNDPIGAAELHTFEGKLGEKAAWSRGLFVSYSGFSDDGLHAFGRGKRTICMDGLDISEMLRTRISVVNVLDAKVRAAAETGNVFARVRDLFVT